MDVIAFWIICSVTSICLYIEQVMARHTFGAHQNVEGIIDRGNEHPNVVMQSVVLGKNGNKSGNDNESVQDENDIEAAVRKLMKLLCPCASNKYNHHVDDEDDEYNDCYNDSYDDISIRRLVKTLSNKFSSARPSNSIESGYIEDQRKRSRNPFKGRRNKNEFMPYRTRSKSKYSRFQENELESNESKENVKRNLIMMRRRYERRRDALASNELDVDGEPPNWYRPDPNIFRPRRRPVGYVGRQRHRDDYLPQRVPPTPIQYKHAAPHRGIPQDILYVPQIDRPIRRRNRFYPPDHDWSAE